MILQTLRFAKLTKGKSLFLCCIAYACAGIGACAVGLQFSPAHPVIMAAAADAAATFVVFLFSVILDNSSVYDPYWSVAPIGILLFYDLQSGVFLAMRQVIVAALVCFWALRLTLNWLLRWQGLGDEDWRYADFRPNRAYWALSFAGFHFFPTAAVFCGCLPLVPVFLCATHAFGAIDAAAAAVAFGSILIEMRADKELRMFRSKLRKQGELLTNGIWSRCRHPNYFGEVAFWWGMGLFGIAADPAYWWTMSGAAVITALFLFISLPMMDKHMLKHYPSYRERMESVPAFIPFFHRKKKGGDRFFRH
ncbi:MAG TPA: DUF1295 domain-containing protein [Chitinivibrionales bacterium]|nr:DUF1295 domain-containing protein [Chitinivibrionales bacterium]